MTRHTDRTAARIGLASIALVNAPAPVAATPPRPLPPPAPPMTGAGPFDPGPLPILPPIPGTSKTNRHSSGFSGGRKRRARSTSVRATSTA